MSYRTSSCATAYALGMMISYDDRVSRVSSLTLLEGVQTLVGGANAVDLTAEFRSMSLSVIGDNFTI